MAQNMYEDLVKAVVDVAQGEVVVDMEMHVDGEQRLLEEGSQQSDLWGINLHPSKFGGGGFVEFDSLINIRPSQNNRSRDVLDPAIRAAVLALVKEKVTT